MATVLVDACSLRCCSGRWAEIQREHFIGGQRLLEAPKLKSLSAVGGV
jgi:hypothetical protein